MVAIHSSLSALSGMAIFRQGPHNGDIECKGYEKRPILSELQDPYIVLNGISLVNKILK